jgi:hypothetical protein
MKRSILKFLIIWIIWLSIISLYFEHIINRPVNGYIQLGLTFVVIMVSRWIINKTVNNLTINK